MSLAVENFLREGSKCKQRNSLLLIPLVLLLASTAIAQQTPRRDPNASAVMAKMMSAAGWNGIASIRDAVATGSMTQESEGSEGDPIVSHVTIKARGGDKFRIEDQSKGTVIIRSGQSAILSDSSGRKSIPWHAAQFVYSPVFPFFMQIGRAAQADTNLTYLGEEQVDGQAAYKIGLERFITGKDVYSDVLRRSSHVTLSISATTFLPLKMEFEVTSTNSLSARMPRTIYWRDYRAVEGIMVPFQIEEWMNSRRLSTMQVEGVQWNTGISDSEFALN